MKKIFYQLFFISIMIFALTGCEKEKVVDTLVEKSGEFLAENLGEKEGDISENHGEDDETSFDVKNDPLLNDVITKARKINGYAIGYPVNQDLHLHDFYEWYIKNEIDGVSLNNVGNPFDSNIDMGVHDIEKEVIEFFAPYFGFTDENIWGIVSASGTDGNNHGIYFGRKYLKNKTDIEPILYVSEESHYSNKRLADLQDIEYKLVPADTMGRMIPEEFEKLFDPTRPALIVYSMGTTFKGAIDDQEAINKIIESKNPIAVYRHVDAALFGGYLPFSEYKFLIDRNVNYYDSIAISGHKFFGIDEPCGLFLTTKEILDAQTSFSTGYLNGDMPMINCSRSATNPLKFYWVIKSRGEEKFIEDTKEILGNAEYLKMQLDNINWPAYINEYSNTVFFTRPSQYVMDKYYLAGEYDEDFGGNLAHIVVMQNLTREKIDMLIDDMKKEVANIKIEETEESHEETIAKTEETAAKMEETNND